jgi:hypothetical protein
LQATNLVQGATDAISRRVNNMASEVVMEVVDGNALFIDSTLL